MEEILTKAKKEKKEENHAEEKQNKTTTFNVLVDSVFTFYKAGCSEQRRESRTMATCDRSPQSAKSLVFLFPFQKGGTSYRTLVLVVIIVVVVDDDDRFCVALASALEQTHCPLVACDSE